MTRRNQVWAAALGAWAELLVDDETATFTAPMIENSALSPRASRSRGRRPTASGGEGNRVIAMHGSTKLPPYRVLPEPPLAFGDGRPKPGTYIHCWGSSHTAPTARAPSRS